MLGVEWGLAGEFEITFFAFLGCLPPLIYPGMFILLGDSPMKQTELIVGNFEVPLHPEKKIKRGSGLL